jgi:hypothetical protein
MVGNGIVPPYFRCSGCVIEQAMACVDDVRKNSSGNVFKSCNIAAYTEKPDTSCCPVYKSKRVDYKTSAYPKTLACIASVGCRLSQVMRFMYVVLCINGSFRSTLIFLILV